MLITPYQIEAAYEYLRVSEPFNLMKLPCSYVVEFHISLDRNRLAWHKTDGVHKIFVSSNNIKHTSTLMWVMAHEMIHLFQSEHRPFIKAVHNKEFHEIAEKVCRIHGFDSGLFV